VRTVGRLAVLAAPFMPVKAEAMWQALGGERPFAQVSLADLGSLRVDGQQVAKPPPLFPKDVAAASLPESE